MGEIVKFKKPKASEKSKGRTLCKSGFHKWQADKTTNFDVKQGKLISRYICKRCGKTKTESK